MTTIWRKVKHNGDDAYAYCGRMDGDTYVERCRYYNPEHSCTSCPYQPGRVMEEEREEE